VTDPPIGLEDLALGEEPTVFIVDDDPAVCQALAMLVESMGLKSKTYGSAREFLDACDFTRPGCVLLDVRMPGISGLELLERLMQRKWHAPVIAISAHGDVPMVVQAMKAGALTFIEKPCRHQEISESVQEALALDSANRRHLAYCSTVEHRIAHLTSGEKEVLEMLVAGKSNKEIAADLGMSVRTIEVRRSKLMKKMRAGSLAELVRMAIAAHSVVGDPQAQRERLAFRGLHGP
jgi:FixJ family two-component response regulator